MRRPAPLAVPPIADSPFSAIAIFETMSKDGGATVAKSIATIARDTNFRLPASAAPPPSEHQMEEDLGVSTRVRRVLPPTVAHDMGAAFMLYAQGLLPLLVPLSEPAVKNRRQLDRQLGKSLPIASPLKISACRHRVPLVDTRGSARGVLCNRGVFF